MWLFKVGCLTFMLLITHNASVNSIDCGNLSKADLTNMKMVARKCKNAELIGPHSNAQSQVLVVDTLTDEEFAGLFSKTKNLKMGIKARNSQIRKMEFPKLTAFEHENNPTLIYLAYNRQLSTVHLPSLPNGTLKSTNATNYPIYLYANPVLEQQSITNLMNLALETAVWTKNNIFNEPGVCAFTDVVRNMSELDNCQKISRHLAIEGAVDDTKTKTVITDVEGYIKITHSNITDLSFLKLKHNRKRSGDYELDEIYANPNLCLDATEWDMIFTQRHTEVLFRDNQHPVICDESATTCIGGNLNDPQTRARIENGNCVHILGDVLIDNVINYEADLTEPLRIGLSRIKKIVSGSLVIINNEGLASLDLLPNLQSIYTAWTDGNCQKEGIIIYANYKLEDFNLLDRVVVFPERCPILSIGGNGADGTGIVSTNEAHHLRTIHGNESLTFLSLNSVEGSNESSEDDTTAIIFCSVSGILLLAGASFFIYKMASRKRRPVNKVKRTNSAISANIKEIKN